MSPPDSILDVPRIGERVVDVDIGCGRGEPNLEFARAVGPSDNVAGLDSSGPVLAEGERRASAAPSAPNFFFGIAN